MPRARGWRLSEGLCSSASAGGLECERRTSLDLGGEVCEGQGGMQRGRGGSPPLLVAAMKSGEAVGGLCHAAGSNSIVGQAGWVRGVSGAAMDFGGEEWAFVFGRVFGV